MPERGSWNPVLSYWMSKNAIRPSFESWWAPFASGSVLVEHVLGVEVERALRARARGDHLLDGGPAGGRVEPLAGRRCHDHAQRRALLDRELGVDQVGRPLDVRPGEVEVVDQRAVERGVQPAQHHEDGEPAEDHPPGMAGEVPGHAGLRTRVRDPAFVLQIGVCEISHECSTSLYVELLGEDRNPGGPCLSATRHQGVLAGYRGLRGIVPNRCRSSSPAYRPAAGCDLIGARRRRPPARGTDRARA